MVNVQERGKKGRRENLVEITKPHPQDINLICWHHHAHQTDLVGLCKRLTAWCVSHGFGLQEYDDNDDDDATIIVKSNILTENVLHRHITRPPVGQICSRKKGRCVRSGGGGGVHYCRIPFGAIAAPMSIPTDGDG